VRGTPRSRSRRSSNFPVLEPLVPDRPAEEIRREHRDLAMIMPIVSSIELAMPRTSSLTALTLPGLGKSIVQVDDGFAGGLPKWALTSDLFGQRVLDLLL